MTLRPYTMIRHPSFLPFVGYTLVCIWPGAFYLGHNAAQFRWMGGTAVLVVAVLCGLLWLLGICLAVVPAPLATRWSLARAFTVGIVGMFILFSQATIRTWLIGSLSLGASAARAASVLVIIGSLAAAWRLSRSIVPQAVVTRTLGAPAGSAYCFALGRYMIIPSQFI